MKKDFLIASEEWSDGIHCPTQAGISGAAFLGPILFGKGFSLVGLFFLLFLQSKNFVN